MSGIENHRDVVMNEYWRLIGVLLLDSDHGTFLRRRLVRDCVKQREVEPSMDMHGNRVCRAILRLQYIVGSRAAFFEHAMG